MAERIQLKGEKKMLRVAEFQKVSTKQFVNAMAEVKSEIAMFDASDIWDKLSYLEGLQKVALVMIFMPLMTLRFPRDRVQRCLPASAQKWNQDGYLCCSPEAALVLNTDYS